MKEKLLIIGDKHFTTELQTTSLKNKFNIYSASDHKTLSNILKRESPNLVLLDLDLLHIIFPANRTLHLFDNITQHNPHSLVIVITGVTEKEKITESVLLRAYDIIEKPLKFNELKYVLNRARRRIKLKTDCVKQNSNVQNLKDSHEILGNSQSIQQIKKTIRSIANTSASVLITGESGTGKEIVARTLHDQSAIKDKPFVVVNAGAIPENLLESELFGYEKGAFTGAANSKPGKFELAEGGTIFLDEIGNMSPLLQCKILRAIENREIERLGATHIIPLHVRIIAATNKNLCTLIKRNLFREDLYYRLNVINIYIPPLRERMADLPELADHFLRKYALREQKDIRTISLSAMEILEVYNWPGNVRELEHVIERSTILCNEHEITVEHLPPEIVGNKYNCNLETHKFSEAVTEFKKLLIRRTMEEAGYNKTKTAQKLGLNRTYLFKLMKELEII